MNTAAANAQSDSISEVGDSSGRVASQKQRLQCLRAQPRRESETVSAEHDALAPVASSRPSATLRAGMLTVDPHEASLGEVLGAIRAVAGFQLDIPSSGLDGRVFDQVGPLPLRAALVQLLAGSGLNYIIQTASDGPQDVTHVFVSSRTGSATESAAAIGSRQPADGIAEDQALYGGFADPSAQEEPAPPPVAVQQAPANPGNVPGVPAGFNLKQAAAEARKSPAEMLDELQKRQLEILDAQAPPP